MRRTSRALSFILSAILLISLCPDRVSADDQILITERPCDINIIPDKYNTGTKGELIKFTGETEQYGKKTVVSEEGMPIIFKKGGANDSFVLNFSDPDNARLKGTFTIKDTDLSDFKFIVNNDKDHVDEMTFVFENCKFDSINMSKEDSRIGFTFNNCTIRCFSGSNATFRRCAFGGSNTDALTPFRNVMIKDSYFSDMNYSSKDHVTHIDGTQIYGAKGIDVNNITYQNCRFEVPNILFDDNQATVNACIMLQLEYADAYNIKFKDLIVNGGSCTVYAGTRKGDWIIKDVSFEDIKVGAAKYNHAFYPVINKDIEFKSVTGIDSLYIGTVDRTSSGTVFSVSNDTGTERKLRIITDKEDKTFTVPAGPTRETLDNGTFKSFTDLPVDIRMSVSPCSYAVCYDVTDENDIKQIRFVNYTDTDVYLSKSLVGINDDPILYQGPCGKDLTYTLTKDGVLTISGNGPMENYGSTKPTPWAPYNDFIRKIIIKEGVTSVGSIAFKECFACEEVVLEKGVKSIGNRSFCNCSMLRTISVPDSLEDIAGTAFIGVAKNIPEMLGIEPTPAPTSTPTPVPVSTSTPVPSNSISGFVERIYKYVLDREPEKEGAAFWSDELYGFRRTGAEVGMNFIDSDEFRNRNTTDEEFVTILYRTFFDREPEAEGSAFWTKALKSGAMDRAAVASGFIFSQEWADTCAKYGIRSGGSITPSVSIDPTDATYAFVERMYTTAMNRDSDTNGAKFWANELSNFRFTGEQVGVMFFLSDEMKGFGLSDEEFVTRLYKTFMDRSPEDGGFNFWVGYIKDGGTREDTVLGFTRSEEFVNKCIEARILPY